MPIQEVQHDRPGHVGPSELNKVVGHPIQSRMVEDEHLRVWDLPPHRERLIQADNKVCLPRDQQRRDRDAPQVRLGPCRLSLCCRAHLPNQLPPVADVMVWVVGSCERPSIIGMVTLQCRGVKEPEGGAKLVVDTVVGSDADEGTDQVGPGHAEGEAHDSAIADTGHMGGGEAQTLDKPGQVVGNQRV